MKDGSLQLRVRICGNAGENYDCEDPDVEMFRRWRTRYDLEEIGIRNEPRTQRNSTLVGKL